jgi:hypothetical protein
MIPYSLEKVSQNFRHPAARIFVKVVNMHLTTRHHIPRDSPLHTYSHTNLKSHRFGKSVYIHASDELKGDEICTVTRLLVTAG